MRYQGCRYKKLNGGGISHFFLTLRTLPANQLPVVPMSLVRQDHLTSLGLQYSSKRLQLLQSKTLRSAVVVDRNGGIYLVFFLLLCTSAYPGSIQWCAPQAKYLDNLSSKSSYNITNSPFHKYGSTCTTGIFS